MKYILQLAIASTLALGIGCTSDSDNNYEAADISDSAASGTVNGSAWKAESVKVEVDGDSLDVTAYGEALDVCGFGFPDAKVPYLMFRVPKAPGEYPLQFKSPSDSQTATLVTASGG